MFPTIDHVEEYLQNKQWDKLLKEYQKYKDTIKDSTESNIVIDMVCFSLFTFTTTIFSPKDDGLWSL